MRQRQGVALAIRLSRLPTLIRLLIVRCLVDAFRHGIFAFQFNISLDSASAVLSALNISSAAAARLAVPTFALM